MNHLPSKKSKRSRYNRITSISKSSILNNEIESTQELNKNRVCTKEPLIRRRRSSIKLDVKNILEFPESVILYIFGLFLLIFVKTSHISS